MKVDKLNCVYRKVGRKYQPIGACEPVNYLTNGIWYIRTKPGSRSLTSVPHIGEAMKIGDAEDISFGEICGLTNIADKILASPEMNELLSKGYSLYDVVNLVVHKCYLLSKNNELQDK